jgi:B9 domain-containing protein 1
MHIPTVPGTYTRYLNAFTPTSSSMLQDFISWLLGSPPEFFNAKFVTEGEGREVTRVKSTGVIKVKINVMTRGMEVYNVYIHFSIKIIIETRL